MTSLRCLGCVAVWLSIVVVGACGGPPSRPDEIVVLNEAPLTRVDPRFAFTNLEVRASHLVAPGLIDLAERGLGPTEGLAESLEEAPDRLTWTARLRPDLKFSDGTPVTADDVKYTFDSVRDPLLGSPYRKTWDGYLDRVEVVDARTVRFVLKAPRGPLRTDLDFGIVSRRHAQPLDDAVRAAARAGQRPPVFDPRTELVAAGPYMIEARSADALTLVRNPHARQPPQTPRLTIRTIRDDNARVLALVGGSADAILNGVTPVVVETLETNPKLQVTYDRSATLTYVGFNLTDPILRHVKVRQAIASAIDRERLIEAKFRGHARLADTPLDQKNRFTVRDVPLWRFDPARARRLLDEAGFPDPDGNGPRPRFHLTWKTSAQRFRVSLAQAMARQLEEIGIAVDVRPYEFATFVGDVRKGNAQLFSLQLTDLVEPDMLRALLHSSRIPTKENGWSGLNRFRYVNKALDALLDDGAKVSGDAERKATYGQVQRLIAADLPLFPLWHEDNVMAYARRLVHDSRPKITVSKIARLEELLAVRKVTQARTP